MQSDTHNYIEGRLPSVKRAKTRLQRNTGARAESILEASLACFAENNYEEVTIPRIAKRIGAAHSLIYYYFADKDALFQSSVLHALQILMERFDRLLNERSDPAAMLRGYLDLNVEMSDTLRSLVRIIFVNAGSSRAHRPSFIDSFIEDFYSVEERILTDFVQQGVDAGLFDCSDVQTFARFISRSIDGIYYGSFMPHGEPIPVAMDYLKSVIFKVLYRDGVGQT